MAPTLLAWERSNLAHEFFRGNQVAFLDIFQALMDFIQNGGDKQFRQNQRHRASVGWYPSLLVWRSEQP